MVTTVSNLVDLLATTFSGDLNGFFDRWICGRWAVRINSFEGNGSSCGTYGQMVRDCRLKTEHMQNNQTSELSGTDFAIDATGSRTVQPNAWSKHFISVTEVLCKDWNDKTENGHQIENGVQNELTVGHNISSRNSQNDRVRHKLTSHNIESVGQAVGVRSHKGFRQITFGIDTAACRTVVLARHPALGTRKPEYSSRRLASLLCGMRVDVCLCPKMQKTNS